MNLAIKNTDFLKSIEHISGYQKLLVLSASPLTNSSLNLQGLSPGFLNEELPQTNLTFGLGEISMPIQLS